MKKILTLVLLGLLTGCSEPLETIVTTNVTVQIKEMPVTEPASKACYENRWHDGHLFLQAHNYGIVHHPDCSHSNCLKRVRYAE